MKYNLPKFNAILIAISLLIVVIGFMVGEPSGALEFNEDIFSVRRITVGPMIALFGFIVMIISILFKPRKK